VHVVGELDPLTGHAAQNRVDDLVARAGLRELDRGADRRVLARAGEQQLVEPEPERGAHLVLEVARGHPPDDPVEGALALHGAEGQALGQRDVPGVLQAIELLAQRAIGVGAGLEDAPDDGEGGGAGGADGHDPPG
jgi:hypothetical protein